METGKGNRIPKSKRRKSIDGEFNKRNEFQKERSDLNPLFVKKETDFERKIPFLTRSITRKHGHVHEKAKLTKKGKQKREVTNFTRMGESNWKLAVITHPSERN